jgi:hypothetical protein
VEPTDVYQTEPSKQVNVLRLEYISVRILAFVMFLQRHLSNLQEELYEIISTQRPAYAPELPDLVTS